VLATHVGPGETKLVAEKVAQEQTRLRRSLVMGAVDAESDRKMGQKRDATSLTSAADQAFANR
jgi:hypothetical protein